MRADVSHADSERFRAVVAAHVAHLHDYCRSLLADRRDAADAAQATLVIAFSLLDRLEDSGRVRAWLLALARRACQNADPVRSQLLRSSRTPGWPSGEPDTDELRPSIGHGRTAGAALNALPAEEREVLDLVYRHYLSSADVAAVLGVPPERATALLARAVASFERLHLFSADASNADVSSHAAKPEGAAALVAGIRSISAIPLVALPPSILAGTISIVLDPGFASLREWLASTVGDLGSDGFPLPPQHVHLAPRWQKAERQRAVHRNAVLHNAVPQSAVLHNAVPQSAVLRRATMHRAARERAGSPVPRGRLVVLAALLVALGAALAAVASNSSGQPNAIAHGIGQNPVGTSRMSIRRATPPLPIFALLPRKHDRGTILPILPVAHPAPDPTSSHKAHPAPSPTTVTPSPTSSPTPTPTTPSPTPSPSPTPTTPTPSSPPPTPTAIP